MSVVYEANATMIAPTIAPTIAPMAAEHLDQVTAVHLKSFPNFFLTFLGARFLRLLYSEIMATSQSVTRVACSGEGDVVGFVAGVRSADGFYSSLVRRRVTAFFAASWRAAIQRPSIVPRLLRALWRPQQAIEVGSDATLMSLAVAPEWANRGIGASLVNGFLAEMKARGAQGVVLTTDRDDNDAANRFYQRLGFVLVQQYVTPEGRGMNAYRISLV